MSLLPWHESIWRRLSAQIAADRLPHGLLIAGPEHSGKSRLVELLATQLLCQGDRPACGECAQCRLLQAGTHPDLLLVSLEESRQIKVEQIRDLIDWAMQTAQQGGRKLSVIRPADKLNLQAANALLKVLEEPPPDTVICLVTSQPSRLLPTLRSRCQKIECLLPSKDEALAWLGSETEADDPGLLLDIAGGNPLRALNHMDDDYLALRKDIAESLERLVEGGASPLQAAAGLSGSDPEQVLGILYQLVADSIVVTMTNGEQLYQRDLAGEIRTLAEQSLDERYSMLARITEARGQVVSTANPNTQMLLEWVLANP